MNGVCAVTSALLVFTIPAFTIVGHLLGGSFELLAYTFTFVVVPLGDMIAGARVPPYPGRAGARWLLRAFPVVCALLYAGLVAWGLFEAGKLVDRLFELVAFSASVGLTAGAVGITAGHELSHRRGVVERLAAYLALGLSWNLHFIVVHPLHHRHLGTAKDPNVVGNRSFWTYLLPAVAKEWKMGWDGAFSRSPLFGLSLCLPLVLTVVLAVFMGFASAFLFVLQGAIATLLLQVVNYIEHWGLSRNVSADGTIEPIRVHHAWSSAHWVSRNMLFNLPLHAQHHMAAGRAFASLFGDRTAPQMPYGYPAMIVLALCPPLWRYTMEPRRDAVARLASTVEN